MKHTKVFATEEETERCHGLAQEARRTPVITPSTLHRSLAETAWKRVHEAVYEKALAHGLPEIEGFYGMTPDGEFVEV